MSPGKLAAQCSHAVLGLQGMLRDSIDISKFSIVVLETSDKKYYELQSDKWHTSKRYYVIDAGYTEVESGTETCFCFLE